MTVSLHRFTLQVGLAALSAPTLVLGADVAGSVLLAVGHVAVVRDGVQHSLARGSSVEVGDTLLTLDGAHIHIRLRDGGLVAVRPNSAFSVEQFEYDSANPQAGRVRYTLKHGVARSVTGRVGEANKDAFRLNTPVAAIGVRGTDFVTAADATSTRVAVRSGAVIVAALGGECSVSALGACAKSGLFLQAGSDTGIVEITAKDRIPRLRKDPLDDLMPDRKSPALPSEPLATQGVEKRDEVRGAIFASEASNQLPVDNVHWGRWAGNLQPASMPTSAELIQQGYPIQIANSRFALGVSSVGDVAHQSGNASFKIVASDAYVFTSEGVAPASIENAKLTVKFDARQFATDFTVLEAMGNRTDLHAAGSIVRGGYLISDPYQSNAQLYGVIAADVRQIGTLFSSSPSLNKELAGAIHWGR